MQPIREIKRKARRDLHHRMAIPVAYILSPSTAPVLIHVRLHNHWNRMGDVKGSRTYPAEIENLSPQLVFDLLEIPSSLLVRGAIVSFQAGEAYSLDHILPPDDQFQHADISPLLADKTTGLPIPNEEGTDVILPQDAE